MPWTGHHSRGQYTQGLWLCFAAGYLQIQTGGPGAVADVDPVLAHWPSGMVQRAKLGHQVHPLYACSPATGSVQKVHGKEDGDQKKDGASSK